MNGGTHPPGQLRLDLEHEVSRSNELGQTL
jgi:hypothetical protein